MIIFHYFFKYCFYAYFSNIYKKVGICFCKAKAEVLHGKMFVILKQVSLLYKLLNKTKWLFVYSKRIFKIHSFPFRTVCIHVNITFSSSFMAFIVIYKDIKFPHVLEFISFENTEFVSFWNFSKSSSQFLNKVAPPAYKLMTNSNLVQYKL